MDNTNLLKMLEYIDPASCDYQEWVNVGMALKHEGYSVNDWDSWSRSDSRYHSGECERKWQSFNGNAQPVTAGTIVQWQRKEDTAPRVSGLRLGRRDSRRRKQPTCKQR